LSEPLDVIVVDNFSSESCVQETKQLFEGGDRVHLLFRPENDGFAKGNNAGYAFARNVLGARMILVLNNDIEILQRDFLVRLSRAYRRYSFAVLGPDIRVETPNQVLHQNPSLDVWTAERARSVIREIEGRLERADPAQKPGRIPGSRKRTWFARRNLVLHGAALVFSPRFVDEVAIPFDPRTFLYQEERILFSQFRRPDFEFVYSPDLVVWHRTAHQPYKVDAGYSSWRDRVYLESTRILCEVLDGPK